MAMNVAQATTMLAQIETIELQLTALKHQVQEIAAQNGEKPLYFADLKGILAGQCSSSEEDIDAVRYQLTPEFIEDIATLPAPNSTDTAL